MPLRSPQERLGAAEYDEDDVAARFDPGIVVGMTGIANYPTRLVVALLISVALVLLGALALVDRLDSHRDPGGGSAQDSLAQFAKSLSPGERLYWLPNGHLGTLPEMNLVGDPEWISTTEGIEFSGADGRSRCRHGVR